jgi:hypothetical protein
MVRLIPNGPQILCLDCGAIANHVTLRCDACRRSMPPQPTAADRAYVEWRQIERLRAALAEIRDAPHYIERHAVE